MTQRLSIGIPIVYVTILLITLGLFSKIYRSRRLKNLASMKLMLDVSPAKIVYSSIKTNILNKKNTTTPAGLDAESKKAITAALVSRASATLSAVIKLKEAKAALTILHQKMLIGDDTWAAFFANERILEAEINDCAAEANWLYPPPPAAELESRQRETGQQHITFAQALFASAGQVVANQKIRKVIKSLPEKHEKAEKEWKASKEKSRKELELELKAENKKEKSNVSSTASKKKK